MPSVDGLLHADAATKLPSKLIETARSYTADLPTRPSHLPPRPHMHDAGHVALVTGTTGNFGCELLESLLGDAAIARVYALNRAGTHAEARQRAAFVARDLDVDLLEPTRFRLVEGDFDAPDFGLDPALLAEIRDSVTWIIHNAWQVNFNSPLVSFHTFFRSLRALLDISITCPYADAPKVQFISSTAVFQSPSLPLPIAEDTIPAGAALGCGYAESKWVGEEMLLAAGRGAGVPVQVVRLGQTCGGRGGHWNETEWFPVIVKSALEAGCLPDVDGDAAFVPNYVAAAAVLEMYDSTSRVLNLVHPRPARMRTLLAAAARELGVPLVPYAAWLARLSRCAEGIAHGKLDPVRALQRNPALALLGFFGSRNFTADGQVAQLVPVSAACAAEAAPSLDALDELDAGAAAQWVAAWRASGFLDAC